MIHLDGNSLTIETLTAIALDGETVAGIDEAARSRMQLSHEWVIDAIHRQGSTI